MNITLTISQNVNVVNITAVQSGNTVILEPILIQGGSGGGVQSVQSGNLINVDNTDPANPIPNFIGTQNEGTVTSVNGQSTDGAITFGTPVTTSGVIQMTLNISTIKTLLDYKEEDLIGTAFFPKFTDPTYVVDLALASDWFILFFQNTTLSFTSLPNAGQSIVRTFQIQSGNAGNSLTLPSTPEYTIIGTYDDSGVQNYATMKFANTTDTGLQVLIEIYQA